MYSRNSSTIMWGRGFTEEFLVVQVYKSYPSNRHWHSGKSQDLELRFQLRLRELLSLESPVNTSSNIYQNCRMSCRNSCKAVWGTALRQNVSRRYATIVWGSHMTCSRMSPGQQSLSEHKETCKKWISRKKKILKLHFANLREIISKSR